MTAIRKLWRGEEPLVRTFWLYAVLPALAFYLADTTIERQLPPVVSPGLATGLMVFFAATLAYTAFAIGAVWRSAGNYTGPRAWFILARLWAVLGVVQIVNTLAPLVR